MICAVVDPYGMGRFLPAALGRHGVECVCVRSEFPDTVLGNRPGGVAIDVRHRGDVAATAGWLRERGVDHVVAGTESGVLLADALSAELGTPGNGMSRPAARRDKYDMAIAVRDAGLAAADTFASASAEDVVDWALRRGEWPVVLKPRLSGGTDNVRFCRSAAEIRTAHATIRASVDRHGQPNETVLAQQYLDGDEYFVNTISRRSAHHIVEVWRYHKRTVAGGGSMYDYEHPVPPDDPAVGEVSDYAVAVLDALEIRNAAAHTEVMLTRRGPVLVECAARLGGSHVPSVVARCLGTDQVECLALAIAGPDAALPTYRLLTHLRYVSLISPRDGVVPGGAGLDLIRRLPSFLDMVLTLPEGAPLPRTVDLATSAGYVYLSSDDPDRVEADYRRLRELEEGGLYDRERHEGAQ